uniref:Uncharacterized protein n=1 Tax=Corethron hystrix TaxID=216773 RepID=A0A7S1BEL7_9STRA|mmetsp:Transcript_23130/g.52873  ORF Transcript_23130/g.52873 Transcript_23130/m.52873 type:complete len:301 (+) Transcript_23130:35-937(+)
MIRLYSGITFVTLNVIASIVMKSIRCSALADAPPSGTLPSIIIGGGRIGGLLRDLGTDADVVVHRGEVVPDAPSSGPIYVCTRNDDLAAVIEATPASRRGDLCFLQNGMLGDLINGDFGLPDDTTQCLLYLAVPVVGADPVDGITEINPEGLTCATGKWASELATRLERGSLRCNLKGGENFLAAALEKHIFICATNLSGQINGDLTVGEVYGQEYADYCRDLIEELIAAGSRKAGVDLAPGTFERLVAYGRSVPDYPTGIKEFQWRNGWFYDITKRARDLEEPDPLPLHTAALKKIGVI